MAPSISRTMKDSFSKDEIFLVLIQQNAMMMVSCVLWESFVILAQVAELVDALD